MLMSTGKFGISIRSLARRLGLPKLYFFVRRTLGVPEVHEAAVSKTIEDNARPDDFVWNVGRKRRAVHGSWIDRSHLVAYRVGN